MDLKLKSYARQAVNKPLAMVGFELARRNRDHDEFIPFRETLTAASEAGLSVGDYIDATYNVPGTTQETIERMADLGVFDGIERVCEIGPGSGRYLEKTLQACNPGYYEIYETAHDWRDWLVQQYGVIAQPTNGVSLAHTPSGSMDLVHAHKVLSSVLNFRTICEYFVEMARVVRDGGTVVFDLATEACLDDAAVERWLASSFPLPVSMVAEQYAVDFVGKRGLSLVGSFLVPMEPIKSQYFVFRKGRPE